MKESIHVEDSYRVNFFGIKVRNSTVQYLSIFGKKDLQISLRLVSDTAFKF